MQTFAQWQQDQHPVWNIVRRAIDGAGKDKGNDVEGTIELLSLVYVYPGVREAV